MLRLPIIVDCTKWTSMIHPHVETPHHCRLYWVDLYDPPTCLGLPIIVDCTEWTSIIYTHMLRSPYHCSLYWVNLYNLPTCWDLRIIVDCTEWTSIFRSRVEISLLLYTVLAEMYVHVCVVQCLLYNTFVQTQLLILDLLWKYYGELGTTDQLLLLLSRYWIY